jgi:hypothetical protein
MFLKSFGAVAGLIGMLFVVSPASANLISNGDFETGDFAGWAVVSAPPFGVLVLQGSSYGSCCNSTGTGPELANHFASFGAGDTPINGVTISQTFNTVVGQTYSFSFNYGALGNGTEKLDFGIFTGGGTQTLTTVADDHLGSTFKILAGTFVAGAGPTSTIRFGDLGGIYDKDARSVDFVVDNVSVTAVPEASTWAMMILGFAGVGFMAYRRRNQGVLRVA